MNNIRKELLLRNIRSSVALAMLDQNITLEEVNLALQEGVGIYKEYTRESVDVLELTVDQANLLKANNVLTIGDLLRTRLTDLQRFVGLGETKRSQLLGALASHGIYLKG